MRNTENIFRKIINVFFFLFSFWILIARVINFSNLLPGNVLFKVLAVLFVLIVVYLITKRYFINCYTYIYTVIMKMTVKQMIFSIVFISLGIKTILLVLFQIDSSKHPDCKVYWSFIQQLVQNGVITEHVHYASRYSYTMMFARFFVPYAQIIGIDNILWMNFLNNILFTIASLLLFDCINFYKGKNRAFFTVVLWNTLPSGIIQVLLLVHENVFVFLHIVSIWILFKIIPSINKKV
ncbi:MAG: hypothetical protein ACI4S2_16530 [Lachnospiraceae bacterium]